MLTLVVEVKVVEFEPGFISQTATYVSAINHTLMSEEDTQTIGLLICKTKDNILAKYAVETSTESISEIRLQVLTFFSCRAILIFGGRKVCVSFCLPRIKILKKEKSATG